MTPKDRFNFIMSTAQGELLHSTLQVLVPLGHMIHVGRVNGQNASTISLELLQKSTTYCSLDPSTILPSDIILGAELMQAVDSYYRKGLIEPIPRVTKQILLNFHKH
jgi:hypothetical protein